MDPITVSENIFEPIYTIGETARSLHLAIPTLRMYEQEGLLIPYRTTTNRRVYSHHDIEHMQVLIDLVRAHRLNLAALRRFASIIPCWEMNNCPKKIYQKCLAFSDNNFLPCWQLSVAQCRKNANNCRTCTVYLSMPELLKNPKKIIKNKSLKTRHPIQTLVNNSLS
jgi:MerR family transcriptional regulator, heat shock protein HspR